MSADELEAEVLKLDASGRARLAEKLLASLEDLSEAENLRLWIEEATRRSAQWNGDAGVARNADVVLRDARARLR